LTEILQRELIYFRYYFSVQFLQIFKYWVLGMALGSSISVFGKSKIYAMFAALGKKKPGILSIISASLLGIISPLCMYGTIPVAASLAVQNMEGDASSLDGELAAFMMSSILLNPQLLFFSAALGLPMLIIRFVICFLCGITAGVLVRCFFKDKQFFNFSGFTAPTDKDTRKNLFLRFLFSFGRNVKATGLFLLIGIALSALFQRYVPAENFARLFGNNRGFGLLMAAAIGVPIYVCGGGTIPLLQTWLNNGMGMGSAAAFMITGPATKITNLGALKIVLGIKHFLLYLVFAILFALASGLAVEMFLPY
jgi:uncharacterized membrane protein YraQ (UPF0718 family)